MQTKINDILLESSVNQTHDIVNNINITQSFFRKVRCSNFGTPIPLLNGYVYDLLYDNSANINDIISNNFTINIKNCNKNIKYTCFYNSKDVNLNNTDNYYYSNSKVTVTPNDTNLPINSPTIIINGTGFDPIPEGNTVNFNYSGNYSVTNSTRTQLTVTFTNQPPLGILTAVVTSFIGSSGYPVQVATVVQPLSVTPSSAGLSKNSPSLIIAGTGFDPIPSGNNIVLSSGTCNVSSSSSTSLTAEFTGQPDLGSLTAVVSAYGGTSGDPVQVATVVQPPSVVPSSADLSQTSPSLVIGGTGFDPIPSGNSVVLSSGTCNVSSISFTSLTVEFTGQPELGILTAVVSAYGGTSGDPVQVATVVPSTMSVPKNVSVPLVKNIISKKNVNNVESFSQLMFQEDEEYSVNTNIYSDYVISLLIVSDEPDIDDINLVNYIDIIGL